jgi:hypothetical protein
MERAANYPLSNTGDCVAHFRSLHCFPLMREFADPSQIDRQAIVDEVRLIAIEAERGGDVVRAEHLAAIVARAYPGSGFGIELIAAMIRKRAIISGLSVSSS